MKERKDKKYKMESFKQMLLNQQIFYRSIAKYPELFKEMKYLAMLPAMNQIRDKFPFPNTHYKMPMLFYNHSLLMKVGVQLGSIIGIGTLMDIHVFIGRWIEQTELGKEWEGTLLTFITGGILCPPIHNFHMEKKGKRVLITLNPDTSIEDIRNEWPDISREKKKAWPGFKKKSLSSNFNIVAKEYIESLKKNEVPDELKYHELTEYETFIAKKAPDLASAKRDVSKFRGKMLVIERKARKPMRIKTKKTDQDIAKELYRPKTRKEVAKKVNLIRQHLRRFKK